MKNKLSPTAKKLYKVICAEFNDHGCCDLTTRQLAEKAGISRGSVVDGKRVLLRLGLIYIEDIKRAQGGRDMHIVYLQVQEIDVYDPDYVAKIAEISHSRTIDFIFAAKTIADTEKIGQFYGKTIDWTCKIHKIRPVTVAVNKLTDSESLKKHLRFVSANNADTPRGGKINFFGLQATVATEKNGLQTPQPVTSNSNSNTRAKKVVKNAKVKKASENLLLERLEITFAEERGCDLPDWRKNAPALQKLWRTPMRKILEMCDGDIDFAEYVVRCVVKHMRDAKLTFSRPVQILATAESFVIDNKDAYYRQKDAAERAGKAAQETGEDGGVYL